MLRKLEVVAGAGKPGLFEIHRFHDSGWERECFLTEDAERGVYLVTLSSGSSSLQLVCSTLDAARAELERLGRFSREHFEHLLTAKAA